MSDAVNPGVFESVMMGAFFHNYKTLLESNIKKELPSTIKNYFGICTYNECCNVITNDEDSESPMDYFFFLIAIIQQQKQVNKINRNCGIAYSMNKTC